ncbi:MAG: outer membrane beta-barrel protein, partial [Chthoniobacterales bacterium]
MAESRLDLYGWIETGITANFDSPNDRQNFGHLLDDRSNEPLLNQLVIGAERRLDPKMADRFDIGFKLQLFYGSDARYLHSTGLLDLTTNDTI